MTLDAERPYRVNPRVAIRPESFGGIAYHYENRRLVFLKSNHLVEVLERLDDHESVIEAVQAVTAAPEVAERLIAALATLESSGVIDAR